MEKKDIEIPFGAHDSELDGFEYIIPEGYEAEIKDGKVVVRKTESEDERIRKAIHIYLDWLDGRTYYAPKGEYSIRDMIAWLEKQGGHAKFINRIQVGDKVTRNEDGVLVNLSQLNRVAKKDEKQGKQKDILEDAILDSNKDGLIADTIRYKREKQGEQKPADKVKPKFKVGDWLVHKNINGAFCITQIHAPHYYLTNKNSFIKFGEEDNYRPWTIKDAKDGDVLCDYHEAYDNPLIFILKKFECVNFGLVRPSDYSSYCFLTAGDIQKFKEGTYHHKHNINPATKEQRDLLFEKMHEAGYEWDADKKELKKIEQNPAETKKVAKGNEREIPNSAWGEEDEAVLDALIRGFEGEHIYVSPFLAIRCLKSLKDRVQPQPKQEWSEEDKRMLRDTIAYVEAGIKFDGTPQLNWLKSLRPQNTWKPSDEQMKILNDVLNFAANHESPHWNDYIFGTLRNLIIQLKKLK